MTAWAQKRVEVRGMPVGPWNTVDLSAAPRFYDTVLEGGVIKPAVADDYGYFALPVTLDFTKYYNVELTFTLPPGGTTEVSLYSLRADDDADASAWYDLAINLESGSPITALMGPALEDWAAAEAEPEPHILVEFRDIEISQVRYRVLDTAEDAYADAPFGSPVILDDTILEPDPTYPDYNDWYATGCPVWDDVVVAAWMTDGAQTPLFEARAVRWVEDELGRPSLDMGPQFTGPEADSMPQNSSYDNDPPFAATDYRSVNYMAKIAPGKAVIAPQKWEKSNPVFGLLISVDEDTLAITFDGYVEAPTSTNHPDQPVLPPTYGTGRVMTSGFVEDLDSPLGNYWFTTFDTATGAHNVHVEGISGFDFSDYACFADCGSYFLGLATPTSTTFYIDQFDDAGGYPDGSTMVRRVSGTKVSSEFDFDATFMQYMPGPNQIFILAGRGGTGQGHQLRVLDPDTWTLTQVATLDPTFANGFMSGLAAWISLQPVDDSLALVGYMTTFTRTVVDPARGGVIGVFDGTTVSDTVVSFPVTGNPYWNPQWTTYNWEAFYVGQGRVISICVGEDNGTPPAGSPHAEAPYSLVYPMAVPGFLASLAPEPGNPAISGSTGAVRRRFS